MRGRASSPSFSPGCVDQPRASSSAIMRPVDEEACLRFRFFALDEEDEGEAVRYFWAR